MGRALEDLSSMDSAKKSKEKRNRAKQLHGAKKMKGAKRSQQRSIKLNVKGCEKQDTWKVKEPDERTVRCFRGLLEKARDVKVRKMRQNGVPEPEIEAFVKETPLKAFMEDMLPMLAGYC